MTSDQLHPDFVVVGGGASAVFVTVALREQATASGRATPRVTVVGTEADVGRGLAYGRAEPHHRLNSPAGKMSLSPSDEQGFLRWLDARGWRDLDGQPADPGSYVPRRVFGDYLAEAFHDLVEDQASGVAFVRGEVVDLERSADGVRVVLADGSTLAAEAAVVAVGNPAPVLVATTGSRVVTDPWADGALDGIEASDRVLLIGTGLTAVDIATGLARRLPGLRLTATSRHLLLPATHLSGPAAGGASGAGAGVAGAGVAGASGAGVEARDSSLGEVMHAFGARFREAARAGIPWQAVLDGARPQFQSWWHAFSVADRRRFLAHVARRWDVHRHRMAPSVRDELDDLIESGTLVLAADVDHSAFDVVVMCTGPHSVAEPGWNPVVDSLLAAGIAVPDPTGLGFETDVDGALVSAAGVADERVFAIGAALKGALWETVAVGEIRQVAARIAARLDGDATRVREQIGASDRG